MADIAASILVKLKNKSLQSGRSNQLCLQLFCQEEFLRRLSNSKYSNNFVLKGGLFIYALTDFDSRVTVDVDFLLRKIPNTPEKLREVLTEIIRIESENDYITFEITSIEPIALQKRYAGIGATIVARIKNTKTTFSIDLGVGDIIVPKGEKREIPTQLDGFTKPVVCTYSIETTIAEKLDAILDLMEFSSRMKDYYDIYYLANTFDFDGEILTKALKTTFENRGHHFTVEQFDRVMTFAGDSAMQKKWKAFAKKIDVKTDNFNTVIKTIDDFLRESFEMAVLSKEFSGNWASINRKWKRQDL
ncbi:MAG: nucleotidyl transferase AbiEii/AbiGii toxin family protein [Oscillospiraceae bacterium]